MTDREAMQMALDILDSEFSSVDGEICRWCDGRLLSKRHNCKLEQTISALRACLAEPKCKRAICQRGSDGYCAPCHEGMYP